VVASTAAPGTSLDDYARLLKLLRKETVFPLKLKALKGKLKSWFPALSVEARHTPEERLLADGHVREADGAVTYH
jgi:hypothetical protein